MAMNKAAPTAPSADSATTINGLNIIYSHDIKPHAFKTIHAPNNATFRFYRGEKTDVVVTTSGIARAIGYTNTRISTWNAGQKSRDITPLAQAIAANQTPVYDIGARSQMYCAIPIADVVPVLEEFATMPLAKNSHSLIDKQNNAFSVLKWWKKTLPTIQLPPAKRVVSTSRCDHIIVSEHDINPVPCGKLQNGDVGIKFFSDSKNEFYVGAAALLRMCGYLNGYALIKSMGSASKLTRIPTPFAKAVASVGAKIYITKDGHKSQLLPAGDMIKTLEVFSSPSSEFLWGGVRPNGLSREAAQAGARDTLRWWKETAVPYLETLRANAQKPAVEQIQLSLFETEQECESEPMMTDTELNAVVTLDLAEIANTAAVLVKADLNADLAVATAIKIRAKKTGKDFGALTNFANQILALKGAVK